MVAQDKESSVKQTKSPHYGTWLWNWFICLFVYKWNQFLGQFLLWGLFVWVTEDSFFVSRGLFVYLNEGQPYAKALCLNRTVLSLENIR